MDNKTCINNEELKKINKELKDKIKYLENELDVVKFKLNKESLSSSGKNFYENKKIVLTNNIHNYAEMCKDVLKNFPE